MIRVSIWTKADVIRRKHIVETTGFGAYSCIQWTDKYAGTKEVDQLAPSSVWSDTPRTGTQLLIMQPYQQVPG